MQWRTCAIVGSRSLDTTMVAVVPNPSGLILMLRLRELVGQAPKRGFQLPAWLDRLLSTGIVATDPDVVRRQRCVNVAAFAFVGNTLSHLVINSLHNFWGLLPVNIYNLGLLMVLPLIPQLHRFGELAAGIALSTLLL